MVRKPARTAALVGAVLLGVLGGCQAPAALTPASLAPAAPAAPLASPGADRAPRLLGESGNVPDELTVFHTKVPAVVRLDADLLEALRQAATDARRDGVTLYVNSGWRSAEYQERLLRDAVAEYGSEAEARRWVATAQTSPHVSGDAVDIGGSGATAWLSRHGVGYGLCQIYDNEPWHYELRPDAVADGCPPRYADPTHDPRMQR